MGRYSLESVLSFKTLVESQRLIFVEIFDIYGVLVRQNLEFFGNFSIDHPGKLDFSAYIIGFGIKLFWADLVKSLFFHLRSF